MVLEGWTPIWSNLDKSRGSIEAKPTEKCKTRFDGVFSCGLGFANTVNPGANPSLPTHVLSTCSQTTVFL